MAPPHPSAAHPPVRCAFGMALAVPLLAASEARDVVLAAYGDPIGLRILCPLLGVL
jgi:hypothetical protein